MNRSHSHARLIAATIVAFGVVLAVLALLNRGETPATTPSAAAEVRPPSAPLDAEIDRLQGQLRANPQAPQVQVALATVYLQKARETGDPVFFERADPLLRQAAKRAPRYAEVFVQQGTLALARHEFAAALPLGRRARRLAPGTVAPYPVLVDALVELGRYDEAERALQRMVDLRPNLAAYARVSYFRELHGDLDGAVEAMRFAVAAGGPTVENTAYVQSLLGGLELARGRAAAARRAFASSLAAIPGYAPARAGRARVLALEGDLPAAIEIWRDLVASDPLPDYGLELGEAELAAGQPAAGARDLALVPAQAARLPEARRPNPETAVFDADHGSPRDALTSARRAWRVAPSVRAADALGWALTRSGRPREGHSWARRALRLGSVDPTFLLHAGLTAEALGRADEARGHLRRALTYGLGTLPWQALRARDALGRLS